MKLPRAEHLASISVCLFAGVVLLLLFFRFLLPGLLPFLIAFAISLLLRPIAARFSGSKKTYIILSLLLMICFFLLIGTLIRLLILRLVREMNGLPELLLQWENRLMSPDSLLSRLQSILSDLGTLGTQINESLSALPATIASDLASLAATFAAKLLTVAPDLLISVVVTVVSTFYFTLSPESVFDKLIGLLPQKAEEKAIHLQTALKTISFRYAKAYLLLLILTFFELFLGFSVLGIKYALLLAVATSLIDLLPILGVGTVLVPYAVISFLMKNGKLGVGLLLLYAIMLVIRQIVEPHLVGKSLGLHPLLTLTAGYFGFRLFGFAGMICAPLFLTVGKQIVRGFPHTNSPKRKAGSPSFSP